MPQSLGRTWQRPSVFLSKGFELDPVDRLVGRPDQLIVTTPRTPVKWVTENGFWANWQLAHRILASQTSSAAKGHPSGGLQLPTSVNDSTDRSVDFMRGCRYCQRQAASRPEEIG